VAEEQADAEDRTEAASPERLRRAREEGDVPLSREVVQLASLGGAAIGLAMLGPAAGRDMLQVGRDVLAAVPMPEPRDALAALLGAAAPVGLGVAGGAAVAAAAATLLQTGFLFSGKALVPKPNAVSPMAGLKRIFGKQGLEQLARALAKVAVIAGALWWSAGSAEDIAATLSGGPEALTEAVTNRLGSVLSAALAATAGIAALDVLWVRFSHARKLRMSRQELRDEAKESDGDPHLRARRRQIMRQRSRRRTLSATAKATVVITNPTHYAVALVYERGRDAAPRIVAKGVDALAARMRETAREHDVPIVPNPPLARALYKLDEDMPIPEEHFRAVAEVIAFVWRLRQPR
jgi:flagellar biosynthetic protein FlhB